jgi:glucose-1-phosphate cytidylyltransferase
MMKAVLLAGGLGTRMREETEFRPKPMVEVGGRPVLWHIMKILASHGIKDFVIAAGYKSEYIKNYFYNYGPANMDFTVTLGNRDSIVFHGGHDEDDWTVSVVDTGLETMTGGRLKRLQDYIGDETFFATYGDGIANVNVRALVDFHESHGLAATMTVTRPFSRFGVVDVDSQGVIGRFREKPQIEDWVNIGYFVLNSSVLDLIDKDSCVFEQEPLHTLAERTQIAAYKHEGFWQPMDTLREAQQLNEIWADGTAPWKTWLN